MLEVYTYFKGSKIDVTNFHLSKGSESSYSCSEVSFSVQ